jgi:hypothetical protein
MEELSTKRKGDIAQLHVASLLMADPELEVFVSACDDGHGSDLAVRSTRTGRWYSVQVKATGPTANPWIPMSSFRETGDYLVAAVVLDGASKPTQVYIIPGTAWRVDTSDCLGRNEGGGRGGPYFEVRTAGAKHVTALGRYAVGLVLPDL